MIIQYDDSAFYFFALSTLIFFLVPSWYSILTQVYRAFIGSSDKDLGATLRTSVERAKATQLRKTGKGIGALNKKSFLLSLALTIVSTAISIILTIIVSRSGENGGVNSFDPYRILGLDHGANLRDIKRAYREMSLRYHPDKCWAASCKPNYMMIQKAHETLTDPVALQNWKDGGNPDGTQSLEISIGLPSFLLESSNRNLVLMCYLIVLVGIIPFCVWRYYSNSSKFGEKDVMYDTYAWYHHNLDEYTTVQSMPEIFAGSAEFRQRNLPRGAGGKADINAMMNKVRARMQKPRYVHPVCITGNVLLHAHLLRRTDELSDEAREDLGHMLRRSDGLIDAMITVCKNRDSLPAALNCIRFGQLVTQAMWVRDNPLLQLPHFTHAEAGHCQKGGGATRATNLAEYLEVPDSRKRGIASFTDDQKADVVKSCSLLPRLTVETKVFVDDEEDDRIYEGDLCTVRVSLTRNNLREGERAGLVHAPNYPFPKEETWWVILGTREGKIVSLGRVSDPSRVVRHDIGFLAPPRGEYEFDLYVVSGSYVGLDRKQEVRVSVLDASVLPDYKVHPEDAKLDDEPTLFEEMMKANLEEDSDSDDESHCDDDEEGWKEATAAAGKTKAFKTFRTKAAAADGDDSDDDSK